MSGSARGSDFVSMAGLAPEIRDLIEDHLAVTVSIDAYGDLVSEVDGVGAAANAIVELLRQKGYEL
jgi:hypothetical protein